MAEQFNSTFIPYGSGSAAGGVSPQGVDVGQIAGTLLPIILSFLSANPTILAQGKAHGSAAVH